MIEKLDRKRESSGDSMIKKIQSQLTETTTCSSNIHRVHIDVTGNKETFEKFKNLETNHSCLNSSTHSTIVDVSHRNSVRLESEKYDQQVQELLSSNIPYTYKPVDSKTLWRSFPVHSTSSMDSCDINQMNDLSHVSGPTSTAPIIPVHSIPEKTNIYIHPLSDDEVIDIFDENDQPVGHSTAFITAYGKPPGKYTAHAYFQKSNNNNNPERLPLQQFDFVIDENGRVSPDFVNLRRFNIQVQNMYGRRSHIVEPLPIQNREQAIRNVRQTFTHSEDTTVAGSSLTSEGDVVVLGDISESMAGDPLQTLVKCIKLFLQKALERKQRIALAVWSTNCYWYQNGAFVDENTENLQQEVESWILEQFHDHGSLTYMKVALEQALKKHQGIKNVLVMCDGDVGKLSTNGAWPNFISNYPNTRFHFTAIGKGANKMYLEKMAQIGGGNFEFSDI